MTIKTGFLFIVFFFYFAALFSQNRFTISGYVEDEKTGERLPDATVYDAVSKKGAVGNAYGFYSFTFPAGDSVALIFSYVGYYPQHIVKKITENETINIRLKPDNLLEAAEITASSYETPINRRDEIGTISIPMKQVEMLPSFGGEADILKAFQLMPGVQSGGEGMSAMYVRGGSPDQNLMLLDDVPLYYVNHLGGFASIFNTDAIQSVKLIKGGFPARYGSRLSSILDVRMKEGDMNAYHGNFSIGLLSAKISAEGPIIRGKTSFMVSYRRMLYDLFMYPISKIISEGMSMGYHFYDINAKINHRFSEKDRLYLSFYSGDDRLRVKGEDNFYGYGDEKQDNKIRWGNLMASLRWNHLYNNKLFSNVTVAYTKYRFLTEHEYDGRDEYFNQKFNSGINDWSAKVDFEYFAAPAYKLSFGGDVVYHTFTPSVSSYKIVSEGEQPFNVKYGDYSDYAWESALFVENELKIGNFFSSNIGLRGSLYAINGERFFSLEPRIFANFRLTKELSLKASFSQMQQNVHMLTNAGLDMPVDLWVPATDKVIPSKATQYTAGFAQSLFKNQYEVSIEGFYKKMTNLIAYRPGASAYEISADWQNRVEKNGIGESYGLEFLFQKKIGKITGWVGYTLSRTTRRFDNINNGKAYDYKYDRRHDVSVVFIYQIKENIDVSATWVYGTGNAFSLPVGQYEIIDPNNPDYYAHQNIYDGVNTFRMKPFHKLDLGVNFHKQKKRGVRTWNISIYNAYNRKNPYFYYFSTESEYDPQTGKYVDTRKTKQVSLFPIIPSVSYSFKF